MKELVELCKRYNMFYNSNLQLNVLEILHMNVIFKKQYGFEFNGMYYSQMDILTLFEEQFIKINNFNKQFIKYDKMLSKNHIKYEIRYYIDDYLIIDFINSNSDVILSLKKENPDMIPYIDVIKSVLFEQWFYKLANFLQKQNNIDGQIEDIYHQMPTYEQIEFDRKINKIYGEN